MKKIVAMVILMVMGLTVMAHGEVRVKTFGEELRGDAYVQYVILVSDSGEEAKLYVTEEESNQLFADCLESKAEEQRLESSRMMWEDIGHTLGTFVFWN